MSSSSQDPAGQISNNEKHLRNEERFRWSAVFQQASEPVYLLNRRRKVLFVNRAWEQLTGLMQAEVKGQVCRRRPRGILAEKVELVLGTMAPPPEALRGEAAQAFRHVGNLAAAASVAAASWWHIDFFPLAGGEGPLAILGKIRVVARAAASLGQPLSEKLLALKDRRGRGFRLDQLVSEVPSMTRLVEQIRLAGQCRAPVLITGASGTGKHWAARAIHESGPGRHQYFACVDCARLAADAVAALLFGNDNRQLGFLGSVFLEEPQHLPRELQQHLRERLDQGGDDVHFPRIIAGFRDDPAALVASGRLLDELHCRLGTLVLALPPLKDRPEDLPWWIERLSRRAAMAAGRPEPLVSQDALELLRAHSWPRNLAELYEVLSQACLRAKGDHLEVTDLPFYMRHAPTPPQKPLPLDAILEQVERRLIVQALRLAQNNKTKAAELLAIWRPRLLRRMENLGIEDT